MPSCNFVFCQIAMNNRGQPWVIAQWQVLLRNACMAVPYVDSIWHICPKTKVLTWAAFNCALRKSINCGLSVVLVGLNVSTALKSLQKALSCPAKEARKSSIYMACHRALSPAWEHPHLPQWWYNYNPTVHTLKTLVYKWVHSVKITPSPPCYTTFESANSSLPPTKYFHQARPIDTFPHSSSHICLAGVCFRKTWNQFGWKPCPIVV